MRKAILIVSMAVFFVACENRNERTTDADSIPNVTSTPPPDTNPIGIMMGDTTIIDDDSIQ